MDKTVKLEVQQNGGAWIHLGDFATEEAAKAAAKAWAEDHGDPHAGHYEARPARPRQSQRGARR